MATTHILIADDDAISREVLAGILEDGDYDIHYAVNGEDALQLAKKVTPDMVLLDVLMPGMNGYEVCRILREDPQLGEIPVVMITGLDDRESRIKGIEAGADDFITKPFDGDELRARVASIARLNRYRRLMAERDRFAWVIRESEKGFVVLIEGDEVVFANAKARLLLCMPEESEECARERFKEMAMRHYRLEPPAAWADWPPSDTSDPVKRFLVRPETDTAHAVWLSVAVFKQTVSGVPQWLLRFDDVTQEVAATRDIWTFHSMVSHKLRTPLSGILGGAELLALSAGDLPPAEIKEIAEDALVEGQRLHREIEEILHYLEAPSLAKPGQGPTLAEVADMARAIGKEMALEELAVDEAAADQARVGLSAQAMETILWELFENARKFHPAKAPAIRVELEPQNGDVALRVMDDGQNLSPEVLAQALAPYYQGEKYHTGEMQGMGLGLSVVASMVWGAGGGCRLVNRPGGPGICVELVLPVQ